jgi:hypothetical protein
LIQESATAVLFDFDPASLSFSPGEQRSVILRATSADSIPAGQLVFRFDPAVVGVVAARPILAEGGLGDGRVEAGRVVLDYPGMVAATGTRPIAEIILVGVAAGRSDLSFEAGPSGANLAGAVVEIQP